MKTLFKHVLSGMEDNNEINGGEFKDWDSAEHAIETYAEDESNFDCDDAEREITVKALDMIIDSNGEKYEEAVDMWNNAVWGQEFGNESGSVAFDG